MPLYGDVHNFFVSKYVHLARSNILVSKRYLSIPNSWGRIHFEYIISYSLHGNCDRRLRWIVRNVVARVTVKTVSFKAGSVIYAKVADTVFYLKNVKIIIGFYIFVDFYENNYYQQVTCYCVVIHIKGMRTTV